MDSDGNGLIEISTHEQFNMIRHNLAGTNLISTAGGDGDASGCVRVVYGRDPCYGYELTADISLASFSYSNWTPIGTCVANNDCSINTSFSGVFDGNNHSISNLTIDISSESYGVGLFGSITSAAILRNLILVNVNISSSSSGSDFGSLVGYGRGASILDVRAVNVTIGAANVGDVGGLLGDGESSTVSSSSVVAHSISASGDYVGGLLGWGASSTVSSSLVLGGSLNGASHVGGIVGACGVIFGANSNPRGVSNSYWLDSIVFTAAQPLPTNTFGESKSESEIRSPTGFTGIYADWSNAWCDPVTGEFTTSPTHSLATAGGGDTYRAWDLGNSMQYPTMTCFGDRLTPAQQRTATTKALNDESPLPAP